MYNVLIRPLKVEDAQISWKWRNDPEVWKFTGSKPNVKVTFDIENEWILKVLEDSTSKRFAIIVDGKYVGNIQLTNLDLKSQAAQYHIFIGDKNYWGKGIAKLATFQILNYAKEILNLKEIYLHVKTNNTNAIEVYKKTGFVKLNQSVDDLQMVCFLDNMPNPTVSIFCMVYNHEKFISECLNGFLIQKCNFNFLIVIGEDCSKDDSRKIILEYVANYPGKFKLLLHDKNIGAHKNQQIVLENCKGKYIALCEGDDYWTDQLKLQKQVDFLEGNEEYKFSMGKVKVLNDSTGEIFYKKSKRVDPSSNETYTLKDYLKGHFSQTSSFVFKNSIEPFPDWINKVHAGDQSIVVLKTGLHGKIKYHNSFFSVYRSHSTSVSKLNTNIQVNKKFILTLDYWHEYLNKEYSFLFLLLKIKYFIEIKKDNVKNRYQRKFYNITGEVITKIINLL